MTAPEAALDDRVARADPDRHAAARAAPPDARAPLLALYAFNLEIARAPYVATEPMIAEMRLQFWADTLDDIAAGRPARAHEVAEPLAAAWRAHDLPVALGHEMIAARQWDIARAPHPDTTALHAHIDRSAGHLTWLAAKVLGAPDTAQDTVRAFARGAGLANWLAAVPALRATGRAPLPDGADIAALARDGQAALARARAARDRVPAACAPALLAGAQADAILRAARAAPSRVTAGTLVPSEFRRRGTLALRALTGRW